MKNFTQSLILIFQLLAAASTLTGQIVYVAPNATGDGSTWSNATGDLKVALENAISGTQIWVKEGTYYPASCSNCVFNDRNQRFQIKNGVKLYGGFSGVETATSQRNIAAHPTYLSGDIDRDGTWANNSFTVVYTQNVSTLTVADGFIITGGNADQSGAGLGTPQTSGGGWFNVGSTPGSSSHPVISNCKFIGNYAWGYGGGMFNDGSFQGTCNPALTNCEFLDNVARTDGGAMYNSASFEGLCSPFLTNCRFENNKTEFADGGGIFNIGSEGGVCNPEFDGCIFINNVAFHEGGAMTNFGKGGNSSPVVENCVFENNQAELGGAVYNDGTFNGYSAPFFKNCDFKANHSTSDGAAMYNSGYQGTCNPEMLNCRFETNNSAFAGGAIFSNGNEGVCNPVVTNCRFFHNRADTYGGAMYNFGKTGNCSPLITNSIFSENMALSAGAVYNLGADNGNANATITNCTFYGNHANVGGAVYCNAGENGTGISSPMVRNCIFWGNEANDEGDVFRIIWGTPTISHSLIDKANCAALYNGNGGIVNCGAGLKFNEDPLFASPESGNFHLSAGSAAVDDGSNAAVNEVNLLVDLDSLPRIFNGTVDMGVFEFGSMISDSPVITQNPQNIEICEGETATLSISATGSQPLVYQWFRNGLIIPGANQNILVINDATPVDNAEYACRVTNATSDTATSQAATLIVNEPATVELTISASQTEICDGEEITLSAQPVHGGVAPVYQWFINGFPFGGSVSSFNIGLLNDGDTFSCTMTSSETCVANTTATSNTVVIDVETVLVAALSIEQNSTVLCEGDLATFTAIPVNGGNAPAFQWMLNGNLVGSNAPTFSTATLQPGDKVSCTMHSSKACVAVNPVNSNEIVIQITAPPVPQLTLNISEDSTFCAGTSVYFSVNVENGASNYGLTWFWNDIMIGMGDAFSISELADGDLVSCQYLSLDPCMVSVSVGVTVSVDSCVGIEEEMAATNNWLVYPNPSHGKIFVEMNITGTFALHLSNTAGQTLFSSFEEHLTIPTWQALDLTNLPQGIYYLRIISDRFSATRKVILN
jgi:hypothetical protein